MAGDGGVNVNDAASYWLIWEPKDSSGEPGTLYISTTGLANDSNCKETIKAVYENIFKAIIISGFKKIHIVHYDVNAREGVGFADKPDIRKKFMDEVMGIITIAIKDTCGGNMEVEQEYTGRYLGHEDVRKQNGKNTLLVDHANITKYPSQNTVLLFDKGEPQDINAIYFPVYNTLKNIAVPVGVEELNHPLISLDEKDGQSIKTFVQQAAEESFRDVDGHPEGYCYAIYTHEQERQSPAPGRAPVQ